MSELSPRGNRSGSSVATDTDQSPDSDTSLAALVKQLADQSSQLVRDELRLARVEMTGKAKKAGIGAGLLTAAAVIGLFGVGGALTTAILALHLALPAWLSALIITLVLLLVAGVAALLGRAKLRALAPPSPERTVDNVKRDVHEIKKAAHR